MNELLHGIVPWVVELVARWGYAGVFIMMCVESSFLPFPSEVAMIPAGYLASQGEMNAVLAVLVGCAGSLVGALINYQLAQHLGLPVLERFGRYLLLKPGSFETAERFFASHGEITTFVARLVPGVRQLISVPAGLARMSIPKFVLYTGLGSGLWTSLLVMLGYVAGANEDVWRPLLGKATGWALLTSLVIVGVYIYVQLRRRVSEES